METLIHIHFIFIYLGKTRLRYTAHFIVHLFELILTAILLDSNKFIDDRIAYTSVGVITGGFFIGLIFFLTYYSAFHPNCTSVGKYYTSNDINRPLDEPTVECSRQIYFHSDIIDTDVHITSRETAAIATVSGGTSVATSRLTELTGDTIDIGHTLRLKEDVIHAV